MSELRTGVVRSLNFSGLRINANRMMRKSMQCVAALLLVTLGSGLAWADFDLTFQGLVQTLNTGGSIYLSAPAGIAVDPAGDVFVVNTDHNNIVEVTAQGVPSILTITGLSTALLGPSGIAIDASGNLYIADTYNNRVVKITPAGAGSVISTGSVTLNLPRGVTLDQSGDIFIADTGNNRIVEVTSGGSAAALTITVSSGSSTLSGPYGVGVNTAGALYIADSGNNRIVGVASGSTTGVVQSILGGVTLSNPTAVTVDRMGNVLIADTGNDRIAEIDTSSNGTVLYTDSISLSGPLSVALDVFGTVYIADTGNSRGVIVDNYVDGDLAPGDATYSINKTAVGFGHVQLGSATPVTLTLPFTTGETALGSVQVLTSGVASLDFTMGSDTTCNGTTGASTSCSVEVSFLPTAPGLRMGSVVLFDGATPPNAILTVPLYGWGDSPIAALSPNTGTVISTGGLALSNPYQVALDGSGNMYVGDYTGKNVTKIPAGGGAATQVALGTPGSTAVQNITGVAVDEAGNLFIGDHQNSRILVVTPSGIVSVLSINGLSPSLGFPTALAFDGAGNLYIADFTNGRIVRVSTLVVAGSTSSGVGTVIGSGSYSFTGSTLTGLTVDSQGNIYAAARTQNDSSIIEITNAGVASELSFPGITPAIGNPQGVAVDAMGNIYVVDTANSRIVELTTTGVASALSISVLPPPSTLSSLVFGVTADSSGNLYIPDWTNNRIVFVNVSGSALSFLGTKVGLISTDSPKTATVTNLGNQPLVFSANPTFTANFSQPTGSSNQCLSSTSLSSGTACNVSVQFNPQSVGSLSAGITVTNNALNVAGNTQQISVSGTGLIAGDTTATVVSISPITAAIGQPLTVTATVTDTVTGHSSTVPTGGVSFMDTVGSTSISLNGGSPVTLSGGVATLTGATLGTAGSHTITATYAGVSGSFLTSTSTTTLALTQDSETITGPVTQPVQVAAGQAGSVPVSVTGPYAGVPAATGSLSYSVLNSSSASVASGTANLTAGSSNSTASIPLASSLTTGTYTIDISYAGDANYAAGTATVMVTVAAVGKATPVVTLASSATTVLAKSAVTFTATVSSSASTPTGSVTFLDGSTSLGSSTLSQGVATLTTSTLAAGVHTITAQYGGDANFTALTSSALIETIQDFSLTLSGSSTSSVTVAPGGTATYDLVVAPSAGTTFPAAVTLSVTGAPTGATTTITPKTLPAGAGATHVTLTVQVPSQTASSLLQHHEILALRLSPMMLGLLLPFAGKIRRRAGKPGRWSLLLLLVISVGSIAGLTGCGGTSTSTPVNTPTSYNMAFTATSGALSQSTTLKLTVQ